MAKIYTEGIVSPKGFNMSAAEPVDQRSIVAILSDLTTLLQVYLGIEVKIVAEAYSKYKLIALPSSTLSNWIKVEAAGATGPQGIPGVTGTAGAPGLSAYALYTQQGGLLSLTDWLIFIKGPKGDTGLQGLQGIQGVIGPIGPIGPQGLTGATGETGSAALKGVFVITLPINGTLAGSATAAVSGVDYPAGWLLTTTGGNLQIQHNLGKYSANTSVKYNTAGVAYRQLRNFDNAYSGIVDVDTNNLTIESISTFYTAYKLKIHILFE